LETKFRPIPLTLLDFLSVLLPGCIWLALFIIAFISFQPDPMHPRLTNPFDAICPIVSYIKRTNASSFLLVIVIVTSFLIGYILKPVAMRLARKLCRPWFFISRWREFNRLNQVVGRSQVSGVSDELHRNSGNESAPKVAGLRAWVGLRINGFKRKGFAKHLNIPNEMKDYEFPFNGKYKVTHEKCFMMSNKSWKNYLISKV
jgi:hypothetical protein